jgi:ABC-type dipeptide/oligopeptide/nickel transport system ATPase component
MVYQDPAQAMNPSVKVGRQLIETTPCWQSKSLPEVCARGIARVRIADPRA